MIGITHHDLQIFANEHYREVSEHLNRKRINKLSLIDEWFRNNGSQLSLKDIILADVQLLHHISKQYSNLVYPKEILYLRTMYNNYFSKSSKHIGNGKYNASVLVTKLGIRVCPYCNRNHINNVDFGKRGMKRTSQLDHFYSKDKYPFLSMSFYNLIPSCPSCNLIKNNKAISFSPYDSDSAMENQAIFNYSIQNANFLFDESEIVVEIVDTIPDNLMKNIEVLGLKQQYRFHNDIVYDLIKRHRLYPESKLNEISKDFPDLFKNKNEMRRILYGNHIHSSDLWKRPLSKLTKDIIDRLNN